jgi:hypothetical protein
VDPKHVVNLSGKDYPLFAGILAEAHERGLQSIETELIQIPTGENESVAIVRATVRMKDGSAFSDYGDASPRNTSARIATALIRMASTRAKGRALRDAINVGQTMLEELGDLEDDGGKSARAYSAAEAPRSPNLRVEAPGGGNGHSSEERREEQPLRCAVAACGKELKPAQVTFSKQHHQGPPLCKSCLDKVGRTP